MLRFNGKEVPAEIIETITKPFMPKGKSKTVNFQRLNARPYEVISNKGKKLTKSGSEKQILTYSTVVMPTYTDKLAKYNEEFSGEGVLQYYKSKSVRMQGRERVEELVPTHLTFARHILLFDAAKDLSLFAFMLLRPDNERNKEWATIKPTYKLMESSTDNKKKVEATNKMTEALNKLASLKDKNSKLLRQVYEANGFTDWEDHVPANGKEADFNSVLAPLYQIAMSNPGKILDMIVDESLDITATIEVVLQNGVLEFGSGTFYWGIKIKPGIEADKRKIVKAPAGRTATEDAKSWFANWLRGNGDVMDEIQTELNIFQALPK